jgi:ABC-2 type transport system ATP-binding protein
MTVIEFSHVSKRFRLQEGNTLQEFVPALFRGKGWTPPFYALRDLSFSIAAGETIGIIGANGSGKSTALKLVAGVMEPSEGKVRVDGRVCPLLQLGAGFHPDLTGRENIYLNASLLGLTNKQIRERFDEIVAFAELPEFIDTPIKRYSSGMYVRLGFAVAVNCAPDILIVDEALSVGDAHFQEKCIEKMTEIQGGGVTILLVSHALPLIERFCSRALILDHGQLVANGNPKEMVEAYQQMQDTRPRDPSGAKL